MTSIWARRALIGASLLFCGAVFFFFQEVHSTLSDLTAGDSVREHQVLYNFTHGRALQTSGNYGGVDGIKANLYAYGNNTAIHVNLTPFVFAPLYLLWPSMEGCYAVVLLVNYLCIAFWILLILRSGSQRGARDKTALGLSVLLLASGLFWSVTAKPHLSLYLGPFFFALFFAHRKGHDIGYWIALALCCGVSEDSSMFMCTWALYLFLFEPEQRRKAVITGVIAAAWTVFAVKGLNTWARQGMTVQSGSDLMAQLRWALTGGRPMMLANLLEISRAVVVFSPILVFCALAFQRQPVKCIPRSLGLIFVAPLSHWGITVMTGGGHHPFPIFLCMLALMCDLMQGGEMPSASWRRSLSLALGAFVFANVVGLYYSPLKQFARSEVLPRLMGYPKPDDSAKIAHDRRVIAFIQTLPRDGSFEFWLDPNVLGFVADRSNFWGFPEYFDQTDYLIIDRKMPEASYIATDFRLHLLPQDAAFVASLSTRDGAIESKNAPSVADYLARKVGTYRIIRDDPDILALERLRPIPFRSPPSSLGLGFLRPAAGR